MRPAVLSRITSRSNRSPLQAPSRAKPGKSGAPRAKQKNTQCEVANNVSGLAEQGVPHSESRWIHFEHKMKDRIQNPPGMVGRAEVCGFQGDDRQPDGRRKPHPQVWLRRRARSGPERVQLHLSFTFPFSLLLSLNRSTRWCSRNRGLDSGPAALLVRSGSAWLLSLTVGSLLLHGACYNPNPMSTVRSSSLCHLQC